MKEALPRPAAAGMPRTTRDATDTAIESSGRPYVIIDTAGLRKSVKTGPTIDYYSGLRAVAAVVLPPGAVNESLLGLSFLWRLRRFEYADGKLVLEQ